MLMAFYAHSESSYYTMLQLPGIAHLLHLVICFFSLFYLHNIFITIGRNGLGLGGLCFMCLQLHDSRATDVETAGVRFQDALVNHGDPSSVGDIVYL